MKKVSIVVPVYNVENYVDRCLKTLTNQTIDDYEIIIIIDGSTDNSIEIVKKYAKQFPEKIKYFETENRGLSAARNFGITMACGEYIGFVDSDDYIDENMYKNMYECAIKNEYEIVTCDYCKVMKDSEKIISLNILDEDTKDDIVLKSRPYAWNKLYKRSLWEKCNIKFPEGLIFEDICTIYPLMMKAEKIGYINNCYYYYTYYREDSIMLKEKRDDLKILQIFDILNKYCEKEGLLKKYNKLVCEINVRHIFYRLNEMKKYDNSKTYNLKFVYKSFKLLKANFPKWRIYSSYAQKMKGIKRIKKIMLFWQLEILLRGKRNGRKNKHNSSNV